MTMQLVHLAFLVSAGIALNSASDVTETVFDDKLDGMPAAFGDFNSDDLTDVFVLSKDGKTLEILFADDEEPLLRPDPLFSCRFKNQVTSVVPGDFDGDVFMDILVTTIVKNTNITYAHVIWGSEQSRLVCIDESKPLLTMKGQPLAIDYNQDMIIDLFGADVNGVRQFWIFNVNRTQPTVVLMNKPDELAVLQPIRIPHANAFLDLNHDFFPDLVITTDDQFEIWHGGKSGFTYSHRIRDVYGADHIGQSLHLDVELTGRMNLVVPVCYQECTKSSIMMYADGWHNLKVDFGTWNFAYTGEYRYVNTITLRAGDFNMDGYPDLLATLRNNLGEMRSFLLENVKAPDSERYNRTFQVRWRAFGDFVNRETVMASFYDFYQDGVPDIILVEFDSTTKQYQTAAFRNSLDYDANFVKVMVLTGRSNPKYPISAGSLGKKKQTYGTNLPGPSITYKTTTQDGLPRRAMAVQLPQSAHFSLNLPYTTFGLGRTPNFIESVTIGVASKYRQWPQIIPNSQMVVIPNPINRPFKWKVQLFVTPSKLILQSAAALTALCGLITIIIVSLYWKERRQDKLEKLQASHRFHFDAM